MRQHQLAARIAAAKAADGLHIARIGDAICQHDVQHEDAIMLMAQLPHPLGGKGFDLRFFGIRHIGVEAVGLDADEHACAQKPPHLRRIILRSGQHQCA